MSAQHTHTRKKTHTHTHTHTLGVHTNAHTATHVLLMEASAMFPDKVHCCYRTRRAKDLSQTLQPFQHPVPVCSLFPPLPLRSSKQYIRLLF